MLAAPEPLFRRLGLGARLGNRLVLQMPAADGAYQPVGEHGHPGAHLARHGALRLLHRHQHGRLMVVMIHNTDMPDAWEREGEDPRFFYNFSPDGYRAGQRSTCRESDG